MYELCELALALLVRIGQGLSNFSAGGIAVIGLGLAGGRTTAMFGLLVGGAMLFVGHYQ